MKIYFSFSLTQSSPEIKKSITKMVDIIVGLGHKVSPEEIKLKDSNYYKGQDDSESKAAQKNITKLKKTSDIVILEASGQSIGIGQELAFALSISKPVIVLYKDNMKPHILRDEGGDSLILSPYNDQNLESVIKDSIEYAASQQDVRFNFFISPAIGNYLDWISKVKKIPRSVFLRGLIEKDMEKNDEYSS
jgi:hypothetical protein